MRLFYFSIFFVFIIPIFAEEDSELDGLVFSARFEVRCFRICTEGLLYWRIWMNDLRYEWFIICLFIELWWMTIE